MKFIPLTDEAGFIVYVNFQFVVKFEKITENTILTMAEPVFKVEKKEEHFSSKRLEVLETPEEIMALLESKD